MASPNSTYTQLFTTTAQFYRRKDVASQVMKRNALWAKLYDEGKVVASGGRSIVEPLEYAENSTYTRYAGYSLWNIQQSDVITGAEFDWKNAAVNVTFSGPEKRMASGSAATINLVKTKVRSGFRTLSNNLSTDLYSDGTADGGLQVGGIQAIVADSGAGTVGGIDSSTYTWWKNIVQSAAAPLTGSAVTPSKTTIRGLINAARLTSMQRGGNPNLLVGDLNYYSFLEESADDLQRYVDQGKTARMGFQVLNYKGMDVIFDGGSGIPSNRMYLLDTEHLKIVVHEDADMEELPKRESINQDAETHPLIWMGNLVTSNRSVQAVIKP